MATLDEMHAQLTNWFKEAESAVVAYSGGTDSALLLKVGHDALGARCVGVIAASPSLPRAELEDALAVAREIGAAHAVIESREVDDPRYQENDTTRCYFCKGDLFDRLDQYATQNGFAVVADGTNADDLGDFRPGREAARERGVRSPLVEAAFTKDDIRELSRRLGLPTWDKPAAACLASRIPHGTRVSADLLARIERAEVVIRRTGIRQLRVRHHDQIARIEVGSSDIETLIEHRDTIARELRALGYTFVTVDLEGFRSGSLNRLVGIDG